MKRNRLFALLLSAAMVLTLAACGGKTEAKEADIPALWTSIEETLKEGDHLPALMELDDDTLQTCCTEEFFRAFAMNAGITLHLNVIYGSNSHHEIEALFKAMAHALKIAVTQNNGGILSTKGVL